MAAVITNRTEPSINCVRDDDRQYRLSLYKGVTKFAHERIAIMKEELKRLIGEIAAILDCFQSCPSLVVT
jgi:uncharacterized small protein (DUF1192 family)